MKILILSCNTGEGHNSAARALRERFAENGHACEIRDGLKFIPAPASFAVSLVHRVSYRFFPGLYRKKYSFDLRRRDTVAHTAGFLLNSGVGRLARYCKKQGFDVILCTHVLPAYMVTRLREKRGCKALTGLVNTDYGPSLMSEACRTDYCFIADEAFRDNFVSVGVSPKGMIASGIPVRSSFFTFTEKNAAKRSLGIEESQPHLLAACGSLGGKTLLRLTDSVVRALPEDRFFTVVCGSDKRSFRRLSKRYSGRKNVRVVGFTDRMSVLMDSADLYLTKPGGITVSEAAVKKLPMVLYELVSAVEKDNMDFYVGRGCAVKAGSVSDVGTLCAELLSDPGKLESMAACYGKESARDSCGVIFRTVTGKPNQN